MSPRKKYGGKKKQSKLEIPWLVCAGPCWARNSALSRRPTICVATFHHRATFPPTNASPHTAISNNECTPETFESKKFSNKQPPSPFGTHSIALRIIPKAEGSKKRDCDNIGTWILEGCCSSMLGSSFGEVGVL